MRPKLADEVELAGLSFGQMKVHESSGRKSVYVNMNGGKFQVETPWLTSSFGIRLPPAEYADPSKPKYSISLSLDGHDGADPKVAEFAGMMKRFERRLIQAGSENGMEWFKRKSLSEEVIEQAMFTKIVKPSIDKVTGEESLKYAPTISATVPYYDGEWKCVVCNDKGEEVAAEDIATAVTGRMRVRAILECSPMWFIGTNKYGCKWVAKLIEYAPASPAVSLDTYAFDGTIPKTVDVSTLQFSDVKVNDKSGAKTVYVNSASGGAFHIQTPWLSSYNGISLPPAEHADPSKPKYSVSWSLKGHDDADSDVSAFHHFLQELDARILEVAKQKPMEWFRKKSISMDVLKSAMFSPQVKVRVDKETGEEMPSAPPSFKTMVPYYDGDWKCVVFADKSPDPVTDNLDVVAGGMRISARAILQCKSIWFFGGRFGCSWKVVQLECVPQSAAGGEMQYAFRTPTLPPLEQLEQLEQLGAVAGLGDTLHSPALETVAEVAAASPATRLDTTEDDSCIDSDME
jgi:hypothetical protein